MTDKLSVLFLTDTLSPGGAERQLTELALRLDRSRFRPLVLCYIKGNFFQEKLTQNGIEVHQITRQSRLDPQVVFTLTRWLRDKRVALIHSFADIPNLYAVLAKVLARKGLVIASVRNTSDVGRTWLDWLLKQWAHHHADLTISNSQAGRDYVAARAKLAPSQITWIPNGLDMDYFRPPLKNEREQARRKMGLNPNDILFLSVGTLYWRKNYRGFIDTLATMTIPARWRFVWVGRSPDPSLIQYIQHQVRVAGIQGTLDVLVKPTHEVRKLYHAADYVVLNSLSEGTPNVVIEALACGVPVIATDVGDTSTYVGEETGWLVPPHENSALAAALLRAGEAGPATRQRMGQAGRERLLALGVTVESVVKSHEDIYLKLLTGETS